MAKGDTVSEALPSAVGGSTLTAAPLTGAITPPVNNSAPSSSATTSATPTALASTSGTPSGTPASPAAPSAGGIPGGAPTAPPSVTNPAVGGNVTQAVGSGGTGTGLPQAGGLTSTQLAFLKRLFGGQ